MSRSERPGIEATVALPMGELIGKHSGPITRHSGESRNPEMLSSGCVLCAWRLLDSGFRRNDGIVYQFIHESVSKLTVLLWWTKAYGARCVTFPLP